MGSWKQEFDPTINQYYYINTKDNTITFDSPNEVKRRKFPCKKTSSSSSSLTSKGSAITSIKSNSSHSSFLQKLGFRRKSSDKGNDSIKSSIQPSKSQPTTTTDFNGPVEDNDTIPEAYNSDNDDTINDVLSLDDEYLLSNPKNFRNFAGTSISPDHNDDLSSIDSQGSIVSYYSELETNEFGTDEFYSFDKEKERAELRQQFLRELEV